MQWLTRTAAEPSRGGNIAVNLGFTALLLRLALASYTVANQVNHFLQEEKAK